MDTFIARKPIFDTRNCVFGYELFHRVETTPDSAWPLGASFRTEEGDETAPLSLAGGKAAFIEFPKASLMSDVPAALDPEAVVIQLQEDVASDYEAISTCRELRSKGFRFAMGGFALHERHEPLLRLAEVVKVDVLASDPEEKVASAEKLGAFKGRLLAENVENQAQHAYCSALGFELFSGFHYLRPEKFTTKELTANTLSVVTLLNFLRDPNSSDAQIQEAFRSDPTLTYKLLQLVNSAALGGRGIDSIGHAIRLLGRDPLYRWLSLFLLKEGSGGGEAKAEIVKSSLLRGRMCELLGEGCRNQAPGNFPAPGTLFLVGLFSNLDTILQTRIEDVLSKLDLVEGVEEALIRREGKAGSILSAVESYEETEWDTAEAEITSLGADPEILTDAYLDSITWARDRLQAEQDA
jgi:EAL and modified HD-GYP domain-containing signal transduction protein